MRARCAACDGTIWAGLAIRWRGLELHPRCIVELLLLVARNRAAAAR